ncbi:MAG: ATP-binding protein [Thermoleophilia bacterium]
MERSRQPAFGGPGAIRRVAPFAAVAVLGVLVMLSPPFPGLWPVVAAMLVTIGVIMAALMLPWARLPRCFHALPPVVYVGAVALMREATDARGTVLPLLMLPVFWIAFYGSRRQLKICLAAIAAALSIPIVAVGEPLYPVSDWRLVLLWTLGSGLVGFRVLQLVDEHASRADEAASRAAALALSEQDLRASEARARRLVEAIPDLVFVVDRDGVLVDVHADEDDPDLIVPPAEALGRGVSELLDPEAAARVLAAIRRAIDEHAVESVEYELAFPEGPRTFEARIVAHDRLSALVLARNITERKALERGLEEQNERLLALDKMKDEFLALVTHELRTPLTSILGYVQLLLEEQGLDEGHRAHLGVVERNSKRLLRLVGDLLFVARIESGKLELRLVDVDLATVAAAAIESQEPRARLAGVELGLEVAPAPTVRADPARLDQLVDNLLSNAIKFTPEGGRVTLRVFPSAGGAAVEVQDTGIGIPEEEQARLFERFYRATTAIDRQIGGTGLGLTICRAIAEAHGGEIGFRSRPGIGTTFRVTLREEGPADAVEPAEPGLAERPAA